MRATGYLARCALLTCSLAGAAWAESTRQLMERGQQLYSSGKYADALSAYQQIVQDTARPDPQLLHNLAATQFKLGELDEARELWVRAATLKDAAFEAQARYNLGNCDYAAALQAIEESQAQPALDALQRAMQYYREAIQLDPGLANARANLELSAQLRKMIEDQSEQQPESQPSNEQQTPNASQPSQDQQQQKEGEKQQEKQKEGQEGDPSTQPSEDQQQPQSQPSEGDESQDQEQPQRQPSQSQPADKQQGEEEQEGQQPPPASQPQEDQKEGGQGERPRPELQITPEQAERLLQMVLDRERMRRQMLQQREAARQRPVDKDW